MTASGFRDLPHSLLFGISLSFLARHASLFFFKPFPSSGFSCSAETEYPSFCGFPTFTKKLRSLRACRCGYSLLCMCQRSTLKTAFHPVLKLGILPLGQRRGVSSMPNSEHCPTPAPNWISPFSAKFRGFDGLSLNLFEGNWRQNQIGHYPGTKRITCPIFVPDKWCWLIACVFVYKREI